jgi:Na+/proline symporter
MPLHRIDVTIVVVYLVVVVAMGWIFSRRAGKDMEAYVLGGKGFPWYVIGISHGVSSLDISGTMWFALILFAYGVKGVYILWIWPLFAMVFRMVYLSLWVRRSNALTGAEWMHTRFGRGGGGNLAHLSVVIYAVVGVVGFLCYAFQGVGKFAAPFCPGDLTPEACATMILCIAAAYLIVGGMYSVVVTDLMQYALLIAAAIGTAIITIQSTTPAMIDSAAPPGWKDLSFGWFLEIDWSTSIPLLQQQLDQQGWSLFTVLLLLLLFKGWLVSMAGPSPGFGIQRVLATRNPREAALESWCISVTVLIPRFLLIASIVVLALVHLTPRMEVMSGETDFEQILPLVLRHCLPVGLVGVVVAGLVASFMSMFHATIHAGTAYIVNDILKRYLLPNRSERSYVIMSYAVGIGLVLIGIGFGHLATSISSVTLWLVAMLFGGYTAPNVLKWHWWRFNGYGFFAGMLAGVVAAIVLPLIFPDLPALYAFPIILAFSAAAAVVVCLSTPPEDQQVLDRFYLTIRPWGFWGPVHRRLVKQYADLSRNNDFVRDMANCALGIVWQTSIVLLPIYFVLRELMSLVITIAVVALTSILLKFSWYDPLGPGDGYLPEDVPRDNTESTGETQPCRRWP